MPAQNYENHRQFVPMYHFVLFALLVATFIGSLVNLVMSLDDHERLYSASLIVVLTVCVMFLFFFVRLFVTRLQDRIIRAEENFRCAALVQRPLDARLTIKQIIGLRFASDEEFPKLLERALAEQLGQDEIKRAVKNWRADNLRV